MKSIAKNYFVRIFKRGFNSVGQETAHSLEAAIERAEDHFRDDVIQTIELIEIIKIEGLVLAAYVKWAIAFKTRLGIPCEQAWNFECPGYWPLWCSVRFELKNELLNAHYEIILGEAQCQITNVWFK